jgi:hypothetical protein
VRDQDRIDKFCREAIGLMEESELHLSLESLSPVDYLKEERNSLYTTRETLHRNGGTRSSALSGGSYLDKRSPGAASKQKTRSSTAGKRAIDRNTDRFDHILFGCTIPNSPARGLLDKLQVNLEVGIMVSNLFVDEPICQRERSILRVEERTSNF